MTIYVRRDGKYIALKTYSKFLVVLDRDGDKIDPLQNDHYSLTESHGELVINKSAVENTRINIYPRYGNEISIK